MDFSKLSNEELVALKKRDYSKLSNETLLELKSGQSSKQPVRMDLGQAIDSVKNAEGVLGTANALLKAPEKMSREGLSQIAEMTPESIGGPMTGNRFADVARGTPKVIAETLAETAPEFVSKAAMLTAGAAKAAKVGAPLAKAVIRGFGKQAEQISGAAPGSLEAAYKDSTLIFDRSKKAASPLYEAGKAEIPKGTNLFDGMYKPEQIVDAAKEYMAKGGKLEAPEALMYRKAIDSLLKSKRYIKDALLADREVADAIVKTSENLSKADSTFKRGIMAESLRNIVPQNKYGGASAFKMGIMTALEGMARSGNTGKVAARLIGASISPAVQGVTATGAGLVGRYGVAPLANTPRAAASATAVLDNLAKKRNRSKK